MVELTTERQSTVSSRCYDLNLQIGLGFNITLLHLNPASNPNWKPLLEFRSSSSIMPTKVKSATQHSVGRNDGSHSWQHQQEGSHWLQGFGPESQLPKVGWEKQLYVPKGHLPEKTLLWQRLSFHTNIFYVHTCALEELQ